jgi:glycosyltransferase involved in cell wall biosynthesis
MKVCFVSGPYRPGSCGISDYVNLLGAELAGQGHSVQRRSSDSSDFFEDLSQNLPDADFYSIQFAPYAFAKRGLSGKSLFRFARAIREKNAQVNFHEIWIGAYPKASWKEKIIGSWQKREILKFLKIARPRVIHASNPAALHRLKQEGVKAEFLYLFGNIPFHSADNQPDEMPKLQVAFFGTLYEPFPYELLGKRLREISQECGEEVGLRIVGRQRDGIGLSKLMKMAQANGFNAILTGELSANEISREFQMCSLGISTTPYDVLGKSGATAAMLEHGLPILIHDDGDTPVENLFVPEPFHDQVFLLNEENQFGHLTKFMQKTARPFFNGVSHVAENMLGAIR